VQNIRGDVFWDTLLGITMYPFVSVQLHDEAVTATNGKQPSMIF
jgi:hypothetical protein